MAPNAVYNYETYTLLQADHKWTLLIFYSEICIQINIHNRLPRCIFELKLHSDMPGWIELGWLERIDIELKSVDNLSSNRMWIIAKGHENTLKVSCPSSSQFAKSSVWMSVRVCPAGNVMNQLGWKGLSVWMMSLAYLCIRTPISTT